MELRTKPEIIFHLIFNEKQELVTLLHFPKQFPLRSHQSSHQSVIYSMNYSL